MVARTTIVTFQPGMADEALRIIHEVLLPSARVQQGWRGALVLRGADAGQSMIVTFWATAADLTASSPPAEIRTRLERLSELVADATQTTCDVVVSDVAALPVLA